MYVYIYIYMVIIESGIQKVYSVQLLISLKLSLTNVYVKMSYLPKLLIPLRVKIQVLTTPAA